MENVFTRSGHRWSDSQEADILIDIILHKMEAGERGIEILRTYTAQVDVQIGFVDGATEQVFFTNRYSGSSPTPFNVAERIQMALISCMDNVADDLKLARAIINFYKNAPEHQFDSAMSSLYKGKK